MSEEERATPEEGTVDDASKSALVDTILVFLRKKNQAELDRFSRIFLSPRRRRRTLNFMQTMSERSNDGVRDAVTQEQHPILKNAYIHARSYSPGTKVSILDAQQFVLALIGSGAPQGVFATTSEFSDEARAYLKDAQHRIVLIDGRELAHRLLYHDLGGELTVYRKPIY